MLETHAIEFLQDLAFVMLAAGLSAVLFHRLKQPIVLGYVLAGILIGPHTLPFSVINDEQSIRTLAELGVTLLMFSLGLDFNLRKLWRVGPTAAWAATLGILSCGWLGYELGRLFGWGVMDAVFLGALLSISSTTIVSKAIMELNLGGERSSEIMIGILIIEDVLAIVMITLLSGFSISGSLDVGEALLTAGNIAIFLAVVLVTGLLTMPRVLGYVARFKSCEIMIVTVLGVCFGIALISVKLGYSVVLGAFVIGVVMAEANEIDRIKVITEPVRDMFTAIFFVSVGMLIDPKLLVSYALPMAIITVSLIVVKVISRQFGCFVAGHDMPTSLRVGMGLAQIGEFSFIIASLGVTLGVTSDFLFPIAVSVSAITAFITPYFMRLSDPLSVWCRRTIPTPIVASLEIYHRWVSRFAASKGQEFDIIRYQIKRAIRMIALNLALIAGIFISAAFAFPLIPDRLMPMPERAGGGRALFWLAAMIISMPVFIATIRKVNGLGMIFAEAAMSRTAVKGRIHMAVRKLITGIILLGGLVGLGLFTLVLSTTILPSRNVLVVLLVILLAGTWVFRRFIAGIYTRAQIRLQETLAHSPAAKEEKAIVLPKPALKNVQAATAVVSADSFAAGRRIHEHSRLIQTGVEIACIEREGVRIHQPGTDEILTAGDRLLLLGSPRQLREARKLVR